MCWGMSVLVMAIQMHHSSKQNLKKQNTLLKRYQWKSSLELISFPSFEGVFSLISELNMQFWQVFIYTDKTYEKGMQYHQIQGLSELGLWQVTEAAEIQPCTCSLFYQRGISMNLVQNASPMLRMSNYLSAYLNCQNFSG